MKSMTPNLTSQPAIQLIVLRTLIVLIATLAIGIQRLPIDPFNRLGELVSPLFVPKQPHCLSTVLKPRQHSEQQNKTQMKQVATCAEPNVSSVPVSFNQDEFVPVPIKVRPQPRNLLAGIWDQPVKITKNNFVNKSLSMWACNLSLGCTHGCRFCYVPDTSTKFLAPQLAQRGVGDPDREWGGYAFLRPWDEDEFLASLRTAENTPAKKLNRDGNRAVMFCTTTDPYQAFTGPNSADLNEQQARMLQRALELIRDHSTLNVRILTRSPLLRRDFDLLRTLGDRVMVGASIPTLDNTLARIYEPHAPAPTKRLETLQAAKNAGLNVFAALAPTYPECDAADLRRTMKALADIEPATLFMEPINIRAENVDRIAAHAREVGRELNVGVFATRDAWFSYSLEQLRLVQRLADELGLAEQLHLWPDAGLEARSTFLRLRRERFIAAHGDARLTSAARAIRDADDKAAYAEHVGWLRAWWNRVSEWPGTANPAPWTPPMLTAHPLTPPTLGQLEVGQ